MRIKLPANGPSKHYKHKHQKNESGPLILATLFWSHRKSYLTCGGVSNVWNGAGEGTVHSSPSAPSHGLAGARSPLPA